MHTNRGAISFVTMLITCCLGLGGFASPAAAKTIVVTTTDDEVNLPFTTDGFCGSGTIADLPHAGEISLREAIIAANNTPGTKSITFAPTLNGATIKLTRGGLALCGGHTTLNGDVDGNDTPDITLDGTAVGLPLDVLDLFSSHNTVKNLQVRAPGVHEVGTIGIVPQPAVSTSLTDNTLSHNIFTGGTVFVGAGSDYSHNFQSFNGATLKHVRVQDNTVVNAPGAGIDVFIFGDHHKVTDVTIAGNTVSGTTGTGIVALGGVFNGNDPNDDGAIDNRLEVTIMDNLLTNNSHPGDTAGIAILGGLFSSSHNQVTAAILDNTLTDNNGNGIVVGSGAENSSQNRVEVKIRGNRLENNAGPGIVTYGGFGTFSPSGADSSSNRLDARIERNTVRNALVFGLWVYGGFGSLDGASNKVANHNEVNAVVIDNTVTDTLVGEGIHLAAGGSGEANDNEVEVTVSKNTVCGSAAADIHAIGGLLGNPFLPDNAGTGNVLEGEISKNTATTVVVEDGVADNSAEVTQSKNVPCP